MQFGPNQCFGMFFVFEILAQHRRRRSGWSGPGADHLFVAVPWAAAKLKKYCGAVGNVRRSRNALQQREAAARMFGDASWMVGWASLGGPLDALGPLGCERMRWGVKISVLQNKSCFSGIVGGQHVTFAT